MLAFIVGCNIVVDTNQLLHISLVVVYCPAGRMQIPNFARGTNDSEFNSANTLRRSDFFEFFINKSSVLGMKAGFPGLDFAIEFILGKAMNFM